ncbi:MAG: hypothetical protein ABIT36_12095 [Steroidobacteraceae bacterium]
MSETSETEEFEDPDAEEPAVEGDDIDLDRVTKDLEMAKRRTQKLGDPAWRRLEELFEQRHTAELVSDIEDYDIGLADEKPRGKRGSAKR